MPLEFSVHLLKMHQIKSPKNTQENLIKSQPHFQAIQTLIDPIHHSS